MIRHHMKKSIDVLSIQHAECVDGVSASQGAIDHQLIITSLIDR